MTRLGQILFRSRLKIVFYSVLVFLLLSGCVFLTQPVFVGGMRPSPVADPEKLRGHVRTLSETFFPRDSEHPQNLERAALYIQAEMRAAGASPRLETYTVRGKTYCNVIGELGPATSDRIVVGAHYDACGEFPGADDNASGAAALLELARLLCQSPPPGRVELAAFTLEEPPYFGSPQMGSAVRSEASRKAGERIRAMLCLEMVGRYSDEPGSQTFPGFFLGLLYPTRANFVALVGRPREVFLLRNAKAAMMRASALPVRSMTAPTSLFFGMTLSDHFNYWEAGYPALMVTDTAFFRNLDYHTAEDTPDKLDYDRMAQAIQGVHGAVVELSR